jgi:multiple sugar transport system permease protein
MANALVAGKPASKGGLFERLAMRWRAMSGLRRQEMIAGYLFLLPNFIGFAVFHLFPILFAFVLVFANWDLASTPRFAGLSNFVTLAGDSLFWQTMGNTFYYAFVSVPTGMLIAFLLALLMNRKIPGILTFRAVHFLPSITLSVAVAVVWLFIYHPQYGLLNFVLSLVGIHGPAWLGDRFWAMPAIIVVSNWAGIGGSMLIFLAGLQGVPDELYEAAVIDGASDWQKTTYITIPLLSPTTFFVLTTSLIGAFQGFDLFYLLTRGGPSFSTTTIVLEIYNNGFQYWKMGYASAMSAALFGCIFVVTFIQWKFAKTWVYGFDG